MGIIKLKIKAGQMNSTQNNFIDTSKINKIEDLAEDAMSPFIRSVLSNAENTLNMMSRQSESYAKRIEIMKSIVGTAEDAENKVSEMRETARAQSSKGGSRWFLKNMSMK